MTICRVDARGLALIVLFLCGGAGARPARADPLGCQPLPIVTDIELGAYADARGLLWRVTAADGRSSVILGTMHLGDPRVTRVFDVARAAFEASRRFALEVLLDRTAMQKFQDAMIYADGRRLDTDVGEALFAGAAIRLQRYGISRELAAAMKPWAVFTTLSLPLETQDGAALDLALLAAAQAAGKEISALETVDEQIAVFERLPERDQVDMLREAVCHYDTLQAEIEEMVVHYAARDLGQLTRSSLEHIDAGRQAFLDALLWSRSRRMVERMQPLLDAGDSFIAIGAMHLPGDRGVLHLLEERGFRLEALY